MKDATGLAPCAALLTVPDAVQLSRIGRTALYAKLAAGEIKAKKAGRRTLIITASLLAHMNALPDWQPTGALN